jgi:hypothetical protein
MQRTEPPSSDSMDLVVPVEGNGGDYAADEPRRIRCKLLDALDALRSAPKRNQERCKTCQIQRHNRRFRN